MADWQGIPDAYLWTGGSGIMGRLMFHAQQVQRGRRKPFSWALLCDLPIALSMGWIAYGVGVWFKMASEPTVSLAIAASYLGPYSVDRVFGALADHYARAKQPAQPQEA